MAEDDDLDLWDRALKRHYGNGYLDLLEAGFRRLDEGSAPERWFPDGEEEPAPGTLRRGRLRRMRRGD